MTFYCPSCTARIPESDVDSEALMVDGLPVATYYSHTINVRIERGSDEYYEVSHRVVEV
jgi:hypothetical protein